MATPQHRIGSGFGAQSTAEEVLHGIDLTGKLAIVTGGYSGIGLETTRALAGADAHVVVPARRRAAAQLGRHVPREEMLAAGWIDEDGNPVTAGFKTPGQGAATQVWAATSPQLAGMGGVYCEDCDIAEPAGEGELTGGVRAYATDPGQAARLWKLSAELTGVDAFASV
ncbi:hypothetical protein [Streptomyces sp. NPDC005283]|uniref:hypothetical protein n=1 Tax=Streptomyces sp. NPDC005283 TaxID=3156871 RepID=UPI0034533E50